MSLRDKALTAYLEVLRVHRKTYETLVELREHSKDRMSQGERVDISHLMHKIADTLTDLRKEANKIKISVDGIFSLVWVADMNPPERVKGQFAAGTPDVKVTPKIPHHEREPEEYRLLMESLEVPEELWQNDALRPHWPGLTELITRRAAEGRPLPKGLIDTSTLCVLSTRSHKGLDKAIRSLREKEGPA